MRYRVPGLALLALLAMMVLPTAASATLAPSVTLHPASLTAGATGPLAIDIDLSPSLGDYPTTLSIALPAGLLLDLSQDNGVCLDSSTPQTGCEVGSGIGTAALVAPVPVSLWLVRGPSPLDVAGAALVLGNSSGGTVAATADVTLRTTPDVGLDISFAALPSGINGIAALNLDLSSLRAPTSCPSPAASVKVTTTASQVGGQQIASTPLTVTGCSSLSYTPKVSGTIDRDSGNVGASFTATVTTSATGSATKALELAVPGSISADPNAALACLLGTPCVIGTASATSPLLPSSALAHGTVNLGGSLLSPSLTVGFPSPYPVALAGSINSNTEALTFTGVPDLPLTSLTLDVGAGSSVKLFTTACAPGTLSARLTPWNGAASLNATSPIGLGGTCSASSPTSTVPSPTPSAPGGPGLSASSLGGLVDRLAQLAFTATQSAGAPPIKRVAITLPAGLSLARTKASLNRGISVRGAHNRALKFAATAGRGTLTIALATSTASARLTVSSPTVAVSSSLSKRVRSQLYARRVGGLRFAVKLTDASGHVTPLLLKLAPKS